MTETDNVPVGRFGHSAVVYQSGMWGARSQKLPTDDRFYRDQSCQFHCASKLPFQHRFGFIIILAVDKICKALESCLPHLPSESPCFWTGSFLVVGMDTIPWTISMSFLSQPVNGDVDSTAWCWLVCEVCLVETWWMGSCSVWWYVLGILALITVVYLYKIEP